MAREVLVPVAMAQEVGVVVPVVMARDVCLVLVVVMTKDVGLVPVGKTALGSWLVLVSGGGTTKGRRK